jgi:small subunit ribosomal protein S16
MSVKIRLARYGAKKKPYYRIVVASTDAPRDGKFLELVGTYDPLKKPAAVTLKQDRVKAWLDKGALPTATVKSLLKKEGFFSKTANA